MWCWTSNSNMKVELLTIKLKQNVQDNIMTVYWCETFDNQLCLWNRLLISSCPYLILIYLGINFMGIVQIWNWEDILENCIKDVPEHNWMATFIPTKWSNPGIIYQIKLCLHLHWQPLSVNWDRKRGPISQVYHLRCKRTFSWAHARNRSSGPQECSAKPYYCVEVKEQSYMSKYAYKYF